MSQVNEPVIREPQILSDYYCQPCRKRGKVGIMRYKGTKRGKVNVIEETFDECATGGFKHRDREVGITVYIWDCDNCGRHDEDTLGY